MLPIRPRGQQLSKGGRRRWSRAPSRWLRTALRAVPSTYATVTMPGAVVGARTGAWRSRCERAGIAAMPGPRGDMTWRRHVVSRLRRQCHARICAWYAYFGSIPRVSCKNTARCHERIARTVDRYRRPPRGARRGRRAACAQDGAGGRARRPGGSARRGAPPRVRA